MVVTWFLFGGMLFTCVCVHVVFVFMLLMCACVYATYVWSCSLRVLVFMLRVCMCSCCVYVLVLHVHDSVSIVYGNFYLSPLVPQLCPKKWGTLRVFSICATKWGTKVGNMSENTGFAPPIVLC